MCHSKEKNKYIREVWERQKWNRKPREKESCMLLVTTSGHQLATNDKCYIVCDEKFTHTGGHCKSVWL